MLPVWPSAYPSDMTYDFFTYAGAPGAYNLALGGGAGIYWEAEGGFSIATSYISTNANLSNPNKDGVGGGGIGTDASGTSATTQIAYAPENWGIAAAYTYASGGKNNNDASLYTGNANPGADLLSSVANSNSFGLSAWWTPEDSGWIPSISTGWGLSDVGNSDRFNVKSATTQSWYVGLEWDNVFLEGNSFGMAVGQPTFITDVDVRGSKDESDLLKGGGYAWEFFYKFQVTDNITVTPAVTYLSAPFRNFQSGGNKFNALSGLVKTTFKF